MKVVVSSQQPEITSPIEPRFGRASYFLLVDTETDQVEVIANEGAQTAHGAGIQAAQCVLHAGAEAIITGHCGPKAFQALAAGGIPVYLMPSGTVAEAVQKLSSGELVSVGSPNVGSHWV